MPNIPEMGEVWGPAASALQIIATGKADPKAAMDDAVKTIKTNIETNHPSKIKRSVSPDRQKGAAVNQAPMRL